MDSIDTSQLLGQWDKAPMGKKKGGLCQVAPEVAQKIIENFGSFLAFLIRVFPEQSKQQPTREDHKKYEKKLLDFVFKKLDQELVAKVNEVSMIRLKYKTLG